MQAHGQSPDLMKVSSLLAPQIPTGHLVQEYTIRNAWQCSQNCARCSAAETPTLRKCTYSAGTRSSRGRRLSVSASGSLFGRIIYPLNMSFQVCSLRVRTSRDHISCWKSYELISNGIQCESATKDIVTDIHLGTKRQCKCVSRIRLQMVMNVR